jgi:hypothetical protein
MQNQIENDAWRENIERANENDFYILPLIALVCVLICTWLAIQIYGADKVIEQASEIILYLKSLV